MLLVFTNSVASLYWNKPFTGVFKILYCSVWCNVVTTVQRIFMTRYPLVWRGMKDTMTWPHLSSCSIPLWIDIAGKFCSTSNWARALQRCTDFTKMITCQSKYVLFSKTLEKKDTKGRWQLDRKEKQIIVNLIWFISSDFWVNFNFKSYYYFFSSFVSFLSWSKLVQPVSVIRVNLDWLL